MRIYIDIDISWSSFKYWVKEQIARYRRRVVVRHTLSLTEIQELLREHLSRGEDSYWTDSELLKFLKTQGSKHGSLKEVGDDNYKNLSCGR